MLSLIENRISARPLNWKGKRKTTFGHNLLDRLIEFWPLDEQSGDRRGVHAGLMLSDNATVTGGDGVFSLASQFTAANTEYLSRANETSLEMGDIDFTIMAWINPDSDSVTQSIVGKFHSTSGQRDYLLYRVNDAALMYVATPTDVTNQATTTSSAVNAGVWSMLVGWHDATANTVNIDVNGGVHTGSTGTAGALQSASASELQIGARQFTGSRIPFGGRIQRVGIWKRILTADERTWLYNGGRGRSYPFI